MSYAGCVVWITGYSGAGKSTLAAALDRKLAVRRIAHVVLDGDALREVFGVSSALDRNYSRDKRLELAFQYARLCRVLGSQNIAVVIATVSLFREVHAWNREHLPGYYEVYLKVPWEELRRRDPKGIYRRFDAGELACVAGLDVAVDEPQNADCVLELGDMPSVEAAADMLSIVVEARVGQ